MVHSVNDIQLVSIVKDTNKLSVWSDGHRDKHEPGQRKQRVLNYNI